jgi:hypothetical protein
MLEPLSAALLQANSHMSFETEEDMVHLPSWPGPGPGRRRAFFSSRYRDHDVKAKNWIYCNSFQITVVQ